MLDFDETKCFLKADGCPPEEDAFIKELIEVAEQYLKDAVGDNVNTNSPTAKLLMKALVSTLYQNREYTIDTAGEKVQRAFSSMILHLQLSEDE